MRSFHGIYPSKNKQQRQLDKDVETVKRKQAATSQATAGMRRLQATQQETATPYVVLSGKVRTNTFKLLEVCRRKAAEAVNLPGFWT